MVTGDPFSITSRTAEWLSKLPQLTELALTIYTAQDLGHIAGCLSRIHNLRKLTLTFILWYTEFRSPSRPSGAMGAVLAANPSLTHLELFQGGIGLPEDIALIFNHVPIDRPLKLEHLGVSANVRDMSVILPHIRSLESIREKSDGKSNIFEYLLSQRIFPSAIAAQCVNRQFIEYINCHPGITSLSVDSPLLVSGSEVLGSLARHSRTLERFRICGASLCPNLTHLNHELSMLQCKNLRHLTLYYGKHDTYIALHRVSTESYTGPPTTDIWRNCRAQYQFLHGLKASQRW
jgi:hypothetical protein